MPVKIGVLFKKSINPKAAPAKMKDCFAAEP